MVGEIGTLCDCFVIWESRVRKLFSFFQVALNTEFFWEEEERLASKLTTSIESSLLYISGILNLGRLSDPEMLLCMKKRKAISFAIAQSCVLCALQEIA